MKLAFIQNFEGHFELLGFFIQYCISRNIYFEIFTWFTTNFNSVNGPLDEGLQWSQTYNKIFHHYQIQWKELTDYKQENFTRTINLTSFMCEMFNVDITIAHGKDEKVPKCVNMGLREYTESPYTYLFFNGISREEKAIVRSKRISVILLGHAHTQTPLSILRKLFINFDDIDFHLINRNLFSQKIYNKNIYLHEKIDSNMMVDLFKQSHYFFCLDDSYYETKVFTTSILHAFSFGSRVILPKIGTMISKHVFVTIWEK
jgi:hypothetical protein